MTIFQPFGDRILIRVIAPEEKSTGGLLVAPVSKEYSNKGEVVAIGEGVTLSDGTVKPIKVQIGDIVLFSVGSGVTYNDKDEDYRIISTRDVLGKIIKGDNNE